MTHELRFAKLRSGIFEPPFWGPRGNVDASCVGHWKKRERLPIGDNCTLQLLTAAELRSGVLSHPLGDLGESWVLYLYLVGKRLIDFL